MIHLKPMSLETFEKFKVESQSAYAGYLASVEIIPLAEVLKHASEQFDRLVPSGLTTVSQVFFDVHESSNNGVGAETKLETITIVKNHLARA